jgi:hypothetical protein
MEPDEVNKLLKFCWRERVFVSPVNIDGSWYLQAIVKNKPKVFKTEELAKGNSLKITRHINERILNCYEYYQRKIKEQ